MRLSCLVLLVATILSLPVGAQPVQMPTEPSQLPPVAPAPAQAAPVAPYEPAPMPPSLASCLACPSGTWCQNGTCVVAPYPTCPAGFVFDGSGACVPSAYGAPAAESVDLEEAQLQAWREQRRMQPRFGLDAEGAMTFMGDGPDPAIGPVGIVWAGLRVHRSPRFGFVLRGGVLAGRITYQVAHEPSATSDHTSLLGGTVEVMPFWGPFGRFFVGPTAWLAYLSFGKSALTSGTSTISTKSSAGLGIGFDCGFLLGDQENVVLSFPVRVSSLHGLTVLASAAIGYQF